MQNVCLHPQPPPRGCSVAQRPPTPDGSATKAVASDPCSNGAALSCGFHKPSSHTSVGCGCGSRRRTARCNRRRRTRELAALDRWRATPAKRTCCTPSAVLVHSFSIRSADGMFYPCFRRSAARTAREWHALPWGSSPSIVHVGGSPSCPTRRISVSFGFCRVQACRDLVERRSWTFPPQLRHVFK